MSVPRKGAVLGMGAVLALMTIVAGCSSEETKAPEPTSSLGGTAVAAVMKTATGAILKDQNITLDGELNCTADITVTQRKVTGSCDGTDTGGNAIKSTLDGTASVTGVNSCSGTFIVTKSGAVINENKDFNCIG